MKKANLLTSNLGIIIYILIGMLIGALIIGKLFNSGAFSINLPF